MADVFNLPEPLVERLVLAEVARIRSDELNYLACISVAAHLVHRLYPTATYVIVHDSLGASGLRLLRIFDPKQVKLWEVGVTTPVSEADSTDDEYDWQEFIAEVESRLCQALNGSAPDRYWNRSTTHDAEFIVPLPAGDYFEWTTPES